MKKYQLSGQVSLGALTLMLLAALLGGALGGLALWAVEHFTRFYLVVAFPIAAGLLVGGLLTLIVRALKVQNLAAIFVCGLLGGLALYSVYQFASYFVTYRGEARAAIEAQSGPISDQELDAIISEFLAQEYGQTGFVGYLFDVAASGYVITRATSSSGGIELYGAGVWIFWAVELAAAVMVAAGAPMQTARYPLDPVTGQRYPAPVLTAYADARQPRQVFAAIKAGNWRQVGAMFSADHAQPYPRIELATARSQDPQADLYVEFHHVLKTAIGQRRGRTISIEKGMISPQEFVALQQAMARPSSSNALR